MMYKVVAFHAKLTQICSCKNVLFGLNELSKTSKPSQCFYSTLKIMLKICLFFNPPIVCYPSLHPHHSHSSFRCFSLEIKWIFHLISTHNKRTWLSQSTRCNDKSWLNTRKSENAFSLITLLQLENLSFLSVVGYFFHFVFDKKWWSFIVYSLRFGSRMKEKSLTVIFIRSFFTHDLNKS